MIFRDYDDLGALDPVLVAEMVEREREWFGAAPFGEYAICSAPACRAVVSADEYFGLDLSRVPVPLPRLEAAGARALTHCPDCGAPLETLMPPERFRPYVRERVLPGTWGVLAFDEAGTIQGATLASRKPLRDALEHMNYRQAYDLDAAQAILAERLGLPVAEAGAAPVFYWNRIGVSARMRGRRVMASLMQRLFAMRRDLDDLPVLSDTFPNTGMYPLMLSLGAEEVIADSEGGVVLLGPPKRAFVEASSGPTRRGDLKAAQARRAGRRHYRGLPPLPPARLDEPVFRVMGPQDLDEVAVRRVTAFFRETFAVAFRQYLFYPSRLEPIAPEAVFGDASGLDLDRLDGLDLSAHPSETGELPRFWHDPQAALDLMRTKLLGKGRAVLYYGPRGDLGAMTFSYPCTLRQAFAWEEWENPVAYSGHVPEGRLRSFARFRDRLTEVLAAHPEHFAGIPEPTEDSPVHLWNCVAVAPAYRKAGLALDLMRRLAAGIPPTPGVLHLGEVMPGSYWHGMMKRAACVEVPGALGEGPGQPLLLVSPLPEHVRRLRLEPEALMAL